MLAAGRTERNECKKVGLDEAMAFYTLNSLPLRKLDGVSPVAAIGLARRRDLAEKDYARKAPIVLY